MILILCTSLSEKQFQFQPLQYCHNTYIPLKPCSLRVFIIESHLVTARTPTKTIFLPLCRVPDHKYSTLRYASSAVVSASSDEERTELRALYAYDHGGVLSSPESRPPDDVGGHTPRDQVGVQ